MESLTSFMNLKLASLNSHNAYFLKDESLAENGCYLKGIQSSDEISESKPLPYCTALLNLMNIDFKLRSRLESGSHIRYVFYNLLSSLESNLKSMFTDSVVCHRLIEDPDFYFSTLKSQKHPNDFGIYNHIDFQ